MSESPRLLAAISSMPAACCSVAADTVCDSEATFAAASWISPVAVLIFPARFPRSAIVFSSETELFWMRRIIVRISEKPSPVALTFSRPFSASVRPVSIAVTACSVSFWIAPMRSPICFDAFCDSSASFLTSSATTAKPRPCSPARAASMAAFRASRFVCPEMPEITSTMLPISFERSPSFATTSEEESTVSAMAFIWSTVARTSWLPSSAFCEVCSMSAVTLSMAFVASDKPFVKASTWCFASATECI